MLLSLLNVIPAVVETPPSAPAPALGILQGYIGVFVIAFLVTVLITPLVRRLAISNGIVDHPDEARKQHKMPIAYLGGVAVYVGIMAGIMYSYFADSVPGMIEYHEIGPENLTDGVFTPQVPKKESVQLSKNWVKHKPYRTFLNVMPCPI